MRPQNYTFGKVHCLTALFLLMHVCVLYAAPYCTPYNGSTFASSGGVNVITNLNVPFTGLVNFTTNTNSFGYQEFSFSGANPVFRKGSTYVITATVTNAAEVKAWIDYDRDSIFQSAEEISFTISGNSATGIVTIPSSAHIGSTRFRIMGAAKPNSILGPCGNMTRGEAEDYTIDLTPPTNCAVPAITSVVDTSSTYSKIKWKGTAGASYQFTYATSPGHPTTAIVNKSADSIELTGLTPATKYYVFVRSVCGTNDFSDWVVDSFTTFLCTKPVITVDFITNETAVASWDSVAGADYEYNVTLSTTPPTGGSNVTKQKVLLQNLKPNTKYCLFVRRRCWNGEVSEWASWCFTTTNVSVETIGSSITSYYPNPVRDILNVTLLREAQLAITDLSGRILLRTGSKDKQAAIDMRGLAPGMYFLQCNSEDQSVTVRVIKSAE